MTNYLSIYMESCLALYDLKVGRHYFNKQDIGYNYYFYEKKLNNGLFIKIRSDGYYLFDFSESSYGQPIKVTKGSVGSYLPILNQRLEVIHAFLACLRFTTQNKARIFHLFDMKFMDSYIICSKNFSDLDQILSKHGPNAFSSDEYMELCKNKLHKAQTAIPTQEIDNKEIIEAAVSILDKVFSSNHKDAVYIMGILYRAAVYHNMGLEIQAVSFLRSIFEWLAKTCYPRANAKAAYNSLLTTHGYMPESEEYKCVEQLRKVRHAALHDLKFPCTTLTNNPIRKSFRVIEKIFCDCLSVKFSIPLGQSQLTIYEGR